MDFLDRLKAHAKRQGLGTSIDLALAAQLLGNASLSSALSGLKLLAKFKGKPAVKATLGAIIDTALED